MNSLTSLKNASPIQYFNCSRMCYCVSRSRQDVLRKHCSVTGEPNDQKHTTHKVAPSSLWETFTVSQYSWITVRKLDEAGVTPWQWHMYILLLHTKTFTVS